LFYAYHSLASRQGHSMKKKGCAGYAAQLLFLIESNKIQHDRNSLSQKY